MSDLELASAVGTVAGAITVLSFIPQTVRVWRSGRTQDLSAGTFVLLVLQAAAWAFYGVLLRQPPLIWTNTCVLLLTFAILVAKLRNG